MTIVRNKKLYTGPGMYIGRPTMWGNDWTHHTKDTKAIHVVPTVKEAVFHFTDWLVNGTDDRAVAYRKALINGTFTDKTLICWCVNATGEGDCHGKILARMVDLVENDWEPWDAVFAYYQSKVSAAAHKYGPRCNGEECAVHRF